MAHSFDGGLLGSLLGPEDVKDRFEGRGRRRLDGHALAGAERELEGPGVEHEPGKALLAGPVAVAEVAEDGVADVVEVDADLVATAGRRADAQEGRAGQALGDLPVGRGGLASLRVDAHAAGAELADRGVDPAAVGRGHAVDEGEVGLEDLAPVELAVEVAVGGGVLGEDDDAARAAVEAVDGEELAGVMRAEEGGEAALAGLGDRDDALGLVHGQEIAGFEEDWDGCARKGSRRL
jgi:hypothetical protein